MRTIVRVSHGQPAADCPFCEVFPYRQDGPRSACLAFSSRRRAALALRAAFASSQSFLPWARIVLCAWRAPFVDNILKPTRGSDMRARIAANRSVLFGAGEGTFTG